MSSVAASIVGAVALMNVDTPLGTIIVCFGTMRMMRGPRLEIAEPVTTV
jgi:hypothetical protein